MPFFRKVLAAIAAIGFAFSSPAQAQVPKDAQGIWAVGDCGSAKAAIMLGRDFAMAFDLGDALGPTVSMGSVRWAGASGAITQHGATTFLPPLANLTECDALPPWAYASLAEAISLFGAMDNITESCATGTGRDCADEIFGFTDVSDDDRISLAELTRLVRGASTFVVYEAMSRPTEGGAPQTAVPVSSLTGATLFLSLTGPVVMRNMVASYDFDGDGFLTLDEVMQDREPLLEYSIESATGASLGAAFSQAMVSKFVEIVMSNAGQLAGPLFQMMFR